MASLGDSFMLPKPGVETEHLWVLITQPDPGSFQAVMVNVTTQRPHSDTTTILLPGDHPFIRQPSVIYYADARLVDVRDLDAALERGMFRGHEPFDSGVLKRIQAGVETSDFTPNKVSSSSNRRKSGGWFDKRGSDALSGRRSPKCAPDDINVLHEFLVVVVDRHVDFIPGGKPEERH